ncbi:hypothetical protein B0I33_104498 [Prauserella shujinwangii]|uniref:Gp6-like head-tail connector protein n=1 Tax=Prauserella shujinwangii TaxID=1453103 RepID=A0A2T0LXC9_9PSEU|nr:hypothetical protein [Prauserella shujinwangii]PRX48680.1 hypothetical protein B0I33_104498 [Prauserella shujinwangii]
MAWPPTLDALKDDLGSEYKQGSDRADSQLERCLDAAVRFVQRVRPSFDYDGDPLSDLPAPTPDLELGTIRLAGRWYIRRRSPDALIAMGELGSARVPSFDADIDRLLGIGRFRGAVFA